LEPEFLECVWPPRSAAAKERLPARAKPAGCLGSNQPVCEQEVNA